MDSYDYAIVGVGTEGCILAAKSKITWIYFFWY